MEEKQVPAAVIVALRVILNHVEPGWQNCVCVVEGWLNDIKAAELSGPVAGESTDVQ